jgi:SAM-dependent methyltransferase
MISTVRTRPGQPGSQRPNQRSAGVAESAAAPYSAAPPNTADADTNAAMADVGRRRGGIIHEASAQGGAPLRDGLAHSDRLVAINIGCGARWKRNWRNVDGGPWTRLHWLRSVPGLERVLPAAIRGYPRDLIRWDLRATPLPFSDGSASVIFSQWVLEYLTVDESTRLLRDCHRILAPGGLIRLCQTNIDAIIESYRSEGDPGPTLRAATRAGKFLESSAPGHTTPSARLFRRGGVQQLFDRSKLEWTLGEAGFTDICYVGFNDGDCPDLPDLEHEWDPPLMRVEARRGASTPT